MYERPGCLPRYVVHRGDTYECYLTMTHGGSGRTHTERFRPRLHHHRIPLS